MSAPAVALALKVVGTALAVKSVVTGLKEGNILKAALGGVGAYMGLSSLGAFSQLGNAVADATSAEMVGEIGGDLAIDNASQLSSSLGTVGADAAVQDIAINAAQGAGLGTQAAGSIFNVGDAAAASFGASGATDLLGTGLINGATGATEGLSAAEKAALAGAPARAGGGFMDGAFDSVGDLGQFVKDNKELVQVGGQALAGYANAKARDDEVRRQLKLDEQRRARIGYTGASPVNLQQRVGLIASNMFK